MERTEKVGLGVAAAGHLALFGLLSLGLLRAPDPKKLEEHPVEVSLVPDVAVEQAAPPAPTPPSASVAPDAGPPEEAAPPPTAPQPEPKPAPAPAPAPAPRPVVKPQPRPEPAPPKPAPSPKPAPKPAPAPKPVAPPKPAPEPVAKPKPAPKPKPAEPAAEAPAKPRPAPAKAAPAHPAKPATTASDSAAKAPSTAGKAARPASTTGSGATETAKATRPRGSRLGADFLKGLADTPRAAAPSAAAPAARLGPQALASIGSAIQRQVQPCANRQVNPGPGAEQIRVSINLRINRDGSLAAPPRVVNHDGVTDENRRYLDRVDDLAIGAFTSCAPLRGLPDELYDAPGGWRNFTLRYKLPG